MTGALLVMVSAVSCGANDTAALAAPSGFRTYLDNSESEVPSSSGPLIAWRTTWRLTWDSVPGAIGYAVHYGTSEGKPGVPDHTETGAELRVEAAAGTSAAGRVAHDRDAALAVTAAQLMVSVAPVGDDGVEGPLSNWFPVGDVPATGEPIGAG